MTILSGNYYVRFKQNFIIFLYNILFLNQYARCILYALAVRSEVWVCRRSLTGVAGSNPPVGMEACLL
jgi:hypothetical protein